AVSLMDKFEHDIMRLSTFPFSGGKVRDELLNQKNYRKLIVNNYIIFYIVNEIDKTVIIMRVLYGSRLHRDLI
ncbi:MAG: type II toxin-antitoxin system RelE/ParE family toxin, partial [Clostridiales bacterium]|nr:type II toxin-antitoxin system RelE/ParE family toxin [Clostridiales bacterium]